MTIKKTAFLFVAGLALCPHPVLAGFQLNNTEQTKAIDITNQPGSASWTPPAGQGAARPPSDPNAPALQIFNERYIPDSVKKKYNISDEWYGTAESDPSRSGPLIVDDRAAPTALAPDDMALPPEEQVALASPTAPVTAPASPVISAAAYPKIESWRARKGETVRAVTKRWSEREGTDMMWAAGNDPVLQKDFSYVGTMQDAVTALFRSTGQELYTQYRPDGMNPVMTTPATTVTSSAPALEPVAPDKTVGGVPYNLFTPSPNKNLETKWFALSGASLKEVLQVWAEDEGAALIWQGQSNYALKDSVSQTGHFEDAVFKALSQFNGDELRPIGQLYSDPASGRKVLVVKTETPS